ncbi:MAG: replication initiation protein [Butyrivibrio sp.]|nr:replication initiation protein [Butyrivibrio sp.]
MNSLAELQKKETQNKTYIKSNTLIQSKGKSTLLNQKILAMAIIHAVQDKNGLVSATVKGQELRRVFGKTSSSFYSQIKECIYPEESGSKKSSIMDWRIIYKDDEKQQIEATNIIQTASFKNGILEIIFANNVGKYITGLKGNYTRFNLSESFSLNSIYSYKLFELCKSEYDKQKALGKLDPIILNMDIVSLKLSLGIIDAKDNPEVYKAIKAEEKDLSRFDNGLVGEKTMASFGNLKRYVLEKARKEINEKTSIQVEYDTIKQGRGGKVSSVNFYITSKEKQKKEKVKDIDDFELMELVIQCSHIIKEELPAKDVVSIIKAANYDIEKVKEAYKIASCQGKQIENLTGFLIKAIKEGYTTTRKSNSFNNFAMDRTYSDDDWEQLEEKLIDN